MDLILQFLTLQFLILQFFHQQVELSDRIKPGLLGGFHRRVDISFEMEQNSHCLSNEYGNSYN